MSSIISTKAAQAFLNNNTFVLSNTYVNDSKMFLHGNKIAWRDKNTKNICFCLCGWDTRTTCERLRALGLPIHHKKGQLYFDEQKINESDNYILTSDYAVAKL